MMLDSLQKIEYELLSKSLDIGVYDYIPNDELSIYCNIGDASANKFSTKTFDGYEVTSSIYVYSYERSMIAVKEKLNMIAKSLSEVEKSDNGFYFEFFEVSSMSVLRIDLDLVQAKIDIKYRVEEE